VHYFLGQQDSSYIQQVHEVFCEGVYEGADFRKEVSRKIDREDAFLGSSGCV